MNKLIELLVSKENIGGLLLLMVVCGFWAAGMVGYLPISGGIAYLIGFLGAKLIKDKPKEIVFYHLDGENFKDYEGFLNRLCNKRGAMLPEEAHSILEKIRIAGGELLSYLAKNDASLFYNENINAIKALFDRHLPNLINHYLKLPKNYSEKVIVNNSLTSKDLLIKQLQMIHEEVNKLANIVYNQDAQKIILYNKILEEKLGKNKFELKIK